MSKTTIICRKKDGDVEWHGIGEQEPQNTMRVTCHDGIERVFVFVRRTTMGELVYAEAPS